MVPAPCAVHFPSREALVLAVYRDDVQKLADSAAELLAASEPLTALRQWFDRLAHYGLIKHGLADALHSATSDGLAGETYGPLVGAITVLLTACEQDGCIRPGIDPDDVLLLLGFLWRIDPGPDACGARRAAARPRHRRVPGWRAAIGPRAAAANPAACPAVAPAAGQAAAAVGRQVGHAVTGGVDPVPGPVLSIRAAD